jgi:5-methylcytosine-specific restriction endonuclease McrA
MPGFMKNPVDNAGAKNGRYTNGKRVGTNKGPTNKARTRSEVIERDGDWCLYCGRPGPGLHLHRVIYGSQGGKYEASNCVQLCAEDHARVHSSKRTWMPLLLEYLAGHHYPTLSYEMGWLKRSGVQQ